MGMDIAVYLAKTLIAWGVPGGVALVLVLVATSRSGKKSKPAGDTDDDDDGTPAFLKQFKRKDDGGVPKEYLKVVPLNERLDSYSYSLAKVTGSKAKATAENRRRQYTKKFNDFLGELEDEQISAVLAVSRHYRSHHTWGLSSMRLCGVSPAISSLIILWPPYINVYPLD
jgi:hypothetical protein